jgi:hypothetical protein
MAQVDVLFDTNRSPIPSTDDGDVPEEFRAATRNSYERSGSSPVTVAVRVVETPSSKTDQNPPAIRYSTR